MYTYVCVYNWVTDSYYNCLLLQCLTSITSTVTLTALARCRWSSHRGLECLKLTASSWFLPNSVWLIMVCSSKNEFHFNISANSQCTQWRTVCYLCRYRGGLGVYGGTASTCSTIIQGKLLLQACVATLTLLSHKILIFAFILICIFIYFWNFSLKKSIIAVSEQCFVTASLHYFKTVLSSKQFSLFGKDQCWSCCNTSL